MSVVTGILSKGIELHYATTSGGDYTNIPGLKSCPDLGGTANKVDVTTLADGNYRYINGVKDFGDLAFQFLYDNSGAESNYRICRGLEEAENIVYFKVVFPDGTEFMFNGEVSTTITGASVDSAIEFSLAVTLNSDIEVTNPTA